MLEPAASASAASTSASSQHDAMDGVAPSAPDQLRAAFDDFDDRTVYDRVLAANELNDSSNVVVYFGADGARVACNLSEGDMAGLLQTPDLFDHQALPVRWINIWNPGRQRAVVEAIARQYGFSKRLTMSIWAWDDVKNELRRQQKTQRKADLEASYPYAGERVASTKRRPGHASARVVGSATASAPMDKLTEGLPSGMDLERGSGGVRSKYELSDLLQATSDDGRPSPSLDVLAPENLATFRMMQGNLNYTSIDQGAHFVCIGANWLHRRPQAQGPDATEPSSSLVPPKHWSWFALCDDHTVLSFHEAAYFSHAPRGEDPEAWAVRELKSMRSNTLKVLRQLSKQGLDDDRLKFMQLTSIRQPLIDKASSDSRPGLEDEHALEGASNLFYYLFEDYSAAFDILDSSRKALDAISSQILKTEDWSYRGHTRGVVPTLYRLNKELRQLHHLFTNYKTLIDRLLRGDPDNPDERAAGDWLSSRASSRFKRLQVQLQSLMLDAIADYLDEKVSLQDTYFNLMTQKDSHSTERLTRSATLLAKLSVFFLPISFMTSYFSVQIPHLTDGYTASTYWGTFAVIASLSFLSLFFFSKVLTFLSERLDGWSDRTMRWVLTRAGWYRRRQRRALAVDDED